MNEKLCEAHENKQIVKKTRAKYQHLQSNQKLNKKLTH